MGAPLLIHQPSYSMLNRWVEGGLLDAAEEVGAGCIVFSPLAQGLLTDRYLGGGVPADSRAAGGAGFLRPEHITDERLRVIGELDALARAGGQTLAQLALRWVRRQPAVSSVLIGASRPAQVLDAVRAMQMAPLEAGEISAADAILGG
jgi:L-glyceraldehyde 3-phosphate reductase